MSPSPNCLLSYMKNNSLIPISVFLLTATVSIYLIPVKPNKERLIKNLNSQLKEEKFEQLYEEACDLLRLNVTKEKFIKRMRIAAARLKAIDGNLAFQRDLETEKSIRWITDDDESVLLTAYQTLERNGKSVTVSISWTSEGKFFDLCVLPTRGTSQEYQVYGVAGKHYSVGDRIVDW